MPQYESTSNQLPLTEATFFILLSLTSEPKHGYAIMKDVQLLSDRRILLSTGTLYGALKRLLDKDWIKPVATKEKNHEESHRPRKTYQLTKSGHRILLMETSRLEKLAAKARLRTRGAET